MKGDASTNLAALKATVGASLGTTLNDSESFKVADTYEVKHTKSTYLKLIVDRAEVLKAGAKIQDCAPGDLVRVDASGSGPATGRRLPRCRSCGMTR